MTLRPWEFRALLIIAIGGTITMMFLPTVPPAAAAGIGGLLTWVLTNLKVAKDDRPDKDGDRDAAH